MKYESGNMEKETKKNHFSEEVSQTAKSRDVIYRVS